MDRFIEIKRRLLEEAIADDQIKAVIVIGSSTRETVKADEYSDLDLIIVTDDVLKWHSNEYPEKLGNVSIAFLEPTLGGGKEKRVIYDEDKDVDFIIMTPDQFLEALRSGVCNIVMNRGYSILYDTMSYEEEIKTYVKPVILRSDIEEAEFINVVNDFYFHNIWAYKKLKRGEIWSAKMSIDAYLKGHLLKMIEVYCHEIEEKDVWHDGRFLDTWAKGFITDELKSCFSHYDEKDMKEALIHTHLLFEKVTRDIAIKKGFAYPESAVQCAKRYIF